MFNLDETGIRNAEELLGIRQGLFPRGFIYGPGELEFPDLLDHYEQVQVPRGFLYIDGTRLNLRQASAADTTLVILGRMTSLLANNPDNHAEHLLRSFLVSEDELHEALDWCGGRYVILIFQGESLRVYHDFLATRSVYFHHTEGLVSSHGKLLALFADKLTPQTGIHAGAHGYRWWDTSEYVEVSSLLSNHYLYSGAKGVSVHRYWPRGENRHLGRDL
ncbi:hypothetical protein [Micrococcoides hystricis]|uniref:DUF4123 domain-containing protein n=1 Tax=Micrococcoides hystricis TaxID=1572761 RepID=A0ABV6PC53_9MICC